MDNKTYQKQRYKLLKSCGLCTHCGRAKAVPGHTLCAECAEVHSAYYRGRKLSEEQRQRYAATLRKRYHKNRENGCCIACGLPLDGKGVRCIACARTHADRNVRYYHERKVQQC